MSKFIITNNDEIYKLVRDEHWLLVSPWSVNIDRRASLESIEALLANKEAHPIPKQDAYRKLNEMFNASDRTWVHNDTLHKVFKDITFLDFDKLVKHTVVNFTLYVGEHQGRVYWVESYPGYFPKVTLLKFEDFDTLPTRFVKWTDAKNVRPIYKFENNKWEVI